MRITARMTLQRDLAALTSTRARLDDLQDQLVTGKRLRRLSDSPTDVPRALSLRGDLAQGAQFKRNIDDGITRLNAADASLDSVTNVLQRAKELAVQAANASLSQPQRSSLATEVSELLNEVIAVGNTPLGRQFMFAGHQTLAPPFTPVGTPPSAVTYNGDSGAIQRDVGGGTRVQVNVPGDEALGSTFAALIALRDDLLNGDTVALRTTDLTALDGALEDVLRVRGTLGSTANRLELSLERLQTKMTADEVQKSRIEDADLVATIVEQNAQQTVLEAALATTARSFNTSLLNFLR